MKQESKNDQNVPINVEIFEPCYWFIAFNHEIQSYNKGNELLVFFSAEIEPLKLIYG